MRASCLRVAPRRWHVSCTVRLPHPTPSSSRAWRDWMVAGASGAEAPAPMSPLLRLSAREAVSRLRARELTPRQLVDACAARLGAHDAVVNAVPILCLERAREAADRLEREGFPDDARCERARADARSSAERACARRRTTRPARCSR